MEEEPQSPTSKSGVRRPMNAFLIFCKRHRSLVRERNPRLDNRSVTRILGELWAKLPLEEKSTYTSLANEYKEAFLKANPDYKWFNPEKNTTPSNRDKPSTRPSNSLTSYTGQIPHTDDNGPTSPSHAPMTSQFSTMIMENKGQGGNPFSASLGAPQGAPMTAQGIPIFPISMAQATALSVPQPVTSITSAITTLAMVAGQPVMVSQTPLMVSLPQQQLTPVTMVRAHLPAGTINSMATNLGNHATKSVASGAIAAAGPEKMPHSDRSVGLFELAQMCSTEHAKIATSGDRPSQVSSFNPTATAYSTITMATGLTSSSPGGYSQSEDKPRLDSKVLQGQVKEALGFQVADLQKGKGQIQNPAGVNHVLDYSLKKNKEAEMARNILRKDAVKSFGIDQVPTSKPAGATESMHLSKLVLDHVIEAMYSHDTVKPPSGPPAVTQMPPLGAPPDTQNRNKLMLTFGEIQERVIRSAVEQSDYNDLLRIKSNPQTVNQLEASLFKAKETKPATVTCDANKENKAENKVQINVEGINENRRESQDGACDAKQNIPIKKRKPRVKDIKPVETANQEPENGNDRMIEDAPSSDDLELDLNDPSDLDAGVRKSKRSNRGRRYQELIQLGYLQPARDKCRKGDDSMQTNPVSQPVTAESENASQIFGPHGVSQRGQFQEIPQGGITSSTKTESEAGRDSQLTEAPPGDDQQPYRKRTYSETDIGHRRTRKRYKTGDFDLDAQIASLPICHIDEVTRRGMKGKNLKIRHHSENSTLNKFAKPADINLLNVAELRGVLRPRSQSMSQAIVGSARRKAPKMSIVRFIQAIRNPKASVVPLLSPVSASGIPPWSDLFPDKSSTSSYKGTTSAGQTQQLAKNDDRNFKKATEPSADTKTNETKTENDAECLQNDEKTDVKDEPNASTGPVTSTTENTDLQDAIGKVTCVNVTAVSELRFEKGSEKTPALVTCQ